MVLLFFLLLFKTEASGESKSETSGHITCIANNLSKIDKNDMYPTIILKSENKYVHCLLKYNNKNKNKQIIS